MPVLTVDAASRLLFDDRLAGRFVAVAGYWSSTSISCPAPVHVGLLDQFCYFVALTDTDLGNEPSFGEPGQLPGRLRPIMAPDSAGSFALWNRPLPPSGELPTPRVVIVGHAFDARTWQCAPGDRVHCRYQIVVDRLAWLDDGTPEPIDAYTELSPRRSVEKVMSDAQTNVDEIVISAHAARSENVGSIDPRLAGLGHGIVWVARVAVGPPDEDGSYAGVVRAIDDGTGAILAEMPLTPADEYQPTRLILDSETTGINDGRPFFTVQSVAGPVVAEDWLNFFSAPIVLGTGNYVVHGFVADDQGVELGGDPSCDLPLTVEEPADLFYRAVMSRAGDCRWRSEEPGQ